MIRIGHKAFTLVELLVVVTIIGILIALLLPAVQGARESGRATQCRNHLKQLGLGCLQHEEKHGDLPSGGWGWKWGGDPDRGFGKKQPGGWLYSVLPFIEQESLFKMGSGGDIAATHERMATPVAIFTCPSRRRGAVWPYKVSPKYSFHIYGPPDMAARSDYAGNGCQKNSGTNPGNPPAGPGSYASGDSANWTNWDWALGKSQGVICYGGSAKMAHIFDGASNSYLIGEKSLCPDYYDQGPNWSINWDDSTFCNGYDWDTIRWTVKGGNGKPRYDFDVSPGYAGWGHAFGSPHPGGFHMVFCDGSVHRIHYDIDEEVHYRLGNRKDGLPVDASKF